MQVARSRLVELLKALHVDSVDGWNNGKLAVRVNQDNGIARYSDTPEPFAPGTPMQTLFSEIVADQAAGNVVEVLDDTPAETEAAPPTANGKPKKSAAPKKSSQKTSAKPPASKSGKTQTHVGKKTSQKAKPPSKKSAKFVARNPDKSSGKVHVRTVPKSKAKIYYDGFASFGAYVKHLAKNPKPLPTSGVLFTTVRELKNAGKGYDKNKHSPVTKDTILKILQVEFDDHAGEKLATNLNNNVPGRLKWKYGIHVWKQKFPDKKTGYFIVGDGSKPQPKELPAVKVPAKPPVKTSPKSSKKKTLVKSK